MTLFGLIACGLWLLWAFQRPIARQFGLIWRPETLGQWGDTFGALNALFAALAFISVLSTLRLQQKQNAEQQEQLADQARNQRRLEIRENRENSKRRRREDVQRFEGSFFQLLELQRQLRTEVALFPSSQIVDAVVYGGAAVTAASERFELYVKTLSSDGRVATTDELAEAYQTIHDHAEGGFGPYFRIVYTILRRISEAEFLSEEDRDKYGNIVRSQLSSADIALIAGNGLISASGDFFNYIVRYRLLKYLPDRDVRRVLRSCNIYPAETFQERVP